jgi:hypothetical protein
MAWIYGVLGLAIWAALAWGINRSSLPQPGIRVDVVQLRRIPSSAQPGLVELVVRNAGETPAGIVVTSVAYLAPLYVNAADLARNNVEADLRTRLAQASPVPPTGTTGLAAGQTSVVTTDLPFTERAWEYSRGQLTVLVAARIRYRDRVFSREREFCQYMNPRTNEWRSCPFLND